MEALTIVGTDLCLVERITGRLTLRRVIISGALSGIWLGLFFTAVMMVWSQAGWALILPGIAMGAVFGIVLNLVPYIRMRGTRDFTSNTQVVAARYAVLARAQVNEFRTILANSPGNLTRPQRSRPVEEPTGPTAFGSRADEQPRFGVRLSEDERRRRDHAASDATNTADTVGQSSRADTYREDV